MILRLWDVTERWVVGILAVAALAVSLWQIAGRYVSSQFAISSGEELAVYLIIWAALLSSSALVRDDGHVRADLVVRLLKPAQQRIVEMVNCSIAVGFCAGLAWYGAIVTYDAYDIGERSVTSLGFPMWVYYAALPVAALLMTIRYIIRLFTLAFRFDPDAMHLHANHQS